jgi:hypothetical protein
LPKIFLESLRIQLLVVSLLQTSVVVQPQMLSKTKGKIASFYLRRGDALNVQIKLCEFVNVRPKFHNQHLASSFRLCEHTYYCSLDDIIFFGQDCVFFPLKLGIRIVNVTLVFLSFMMMVL